MSNSQSKKSYDYGALRYLPTRQAMAIEGWLKELMNIKAST